MVPKIKITRDFVSTMNQQKKQYETKKSQLKKEIQDELHKKIIKQSATTTTIITNGSSRD